LQHTAVKVTAIATEAPTSVHAPIQALLGASDATIHPGIVRCIRRNNSATTGAQVFIFLAIVPEF